MLWTLLVPALAEDLDLPVLSITADAGVVVAWSLNADDWAAIQRRVVKEPPKIMVEVAHGGMTRKQLVHLTELSGTREVAPGAWPPGLTATVTLDAWGAGEFTRIVTPHGSGTSIRVAVQGGVAGASPMGDALGSGTSPAPVPRPAPAPQPRGPVSGGVHVEKPDVDAQTVVNALLQAEAAARRAAEERARREAMEAQRRAWEEQRRAQIAWLQEIASDANHPVTRACTTAFQQPLDGKCVEIAAYRQDGGAEVDACGALPENRRFDCVRMLGSLNPGWSLAPTITACQGFVEPLECIDTLARRVTEPPEGMAPTCREVFRGDNQRKCLELAGRPHAAAEVKACARLEEEGRRVECIERVEEPRFLPHFIVDACIDAYGAADARPMRCFSYAAAAETPPVEDIVACAAAFDDDADRARCIKRYGPLAWSPVPVLEACAAHFPADARTRCMDEVSAGVTEAPDVAVIPACAGAFGDPEAAAVCLKLMRNRPGDTAGAVTACAALFEGDKDRLGCVELARRDPSPTRIAACASEEKDARRRKCVEGP